MFRIIQVGMNSELLQKLDDLRIAYPETNRMGIINALIAEAHSELLRSTASRSAECDVIEMKQAA